MGTFFKKILAWQVLYFNLFIFCDRDNVKGVLQKNSELSALKILLSAANSLTFIFIRLVPGFV